MLPNWLNKVLIRKGRRATSTQQQPKIESQFSGYVTWTVLLEDEFEFVLSTDPEDPLLQEFFREYDKAFVLPDEKEEIAGFKTCMKLNDGRGYQRLESQFGSFRELISIVRERSTGKFVGGASFIALAGETNESDALLTLNLGYIFVDAAFRGQGWSRRIVNLVIDQTRKIFGFKDAKPKVLVFVEQNDPLRLSPSDYEKDSAYAGLDQVDRLRVWNRLGAKLIDIDYCQPALSVTQLPATDLLYSVIGESTNELDACVVRRHVKAYFTISVLKGEVFSNSPVARRLFQELDQLCTTRSPIRLYDPGPILETLRSQKPPRDSKSLLNLIKKSTLYKQG